MSKSDEIVDLEMLETAVAVAAVLGEKENQTLTWTLLSRDTSIKESYLNAALEYGCEHEIFEWKKGNYYKLLKNYVIPEEAYYQTISACLSDLWEKEGFDKSGFYIEDTSRKDSKIQGRWTRPDLTLVSHRKFPWTMGSEFDVVTFEVKRPDSANVLAVFEALSHATAATKAYVVFPISFATWKSANPAQERRVTEECARHGVGLIFVERSKKGWIATHHLNALRREIDHEKCSNFLDAVVTPAGKSLIAKWK